MTDALDISEVVRRTGLNARTLRFYETRGLVAPLRTHSGRRLYGVGELERINRIVALKRGGLSIAQIQRALSERQIDLVALIDEQLAVLEARQAEIGRARALLIQAVIQLDPGDPPDAATLCGLIRQGIERQEDAAARVNQLFDGLDLEALRSRWADLTSRIEAAMPVDPASAEAQTLFDEVEPLFAPFFAWWKTRGAKIAARPGEPPVAMEQLPGWPRFSAQVWQFLFAVRRHREECGASGS
jgi:DNA-binding transcriptional MerR regulator